MISSIEYRGPDDSSDLYLDDIHMGSVRLAVIDPKDGLQPIRACNPEQLCVYNGEIYNYHVLRQQLVVAGHRLSSNGDSAIIPHLYEQHGIDFVARLRGMFALALWDGTQRRLLLARDRLGIKPLFIAQTADFLVFASEVKAIIASGVVSPSLDLESVDDLFSLSYPCPPRTMFAGIREVTPASVLEARARKGGVSVRRYWAAPAPHMGEHDRISWPDAEEKLRSLLRLRVYDHLSADVPVAAYLSGGLDSSVVAALMKDVTGDPPETFSISFSDSFYDESEFSQLMNQHLGSAGNAVECSSDLAQDFERMIWHTELPLQFPLALPMMKMSQFVRSKGYPVVLTGEGADELMGGYDCFRAEKMRRVLDRPGLRFLRPLIYRQLYKWHRMPDGTVDMMIQNHRVAGSVTGRFGGVLPPWYDMWTTVGIDRARLLGASGRKVRPVDEPPDGFLDLLPPDLERMHPLDAAISIERATRLPSWILLIGDRASMSSGVEARVPLLDHEVVELVARLPPEMKMKGFLEKAILRTAFRDLVPPQIANRRKRPFFTPISEWFFTGNAPEFVRHHLSRDALKSVGVFDADLVHQYLRELRVIPDGMLMKSRLEWTLMLILGTQVLSDLFVSGACQQAPVRSVT